MINPMEKEFIESQKLLQVKTLLLLIIAISALMSLSAYIRFPICYDDAYITFRYAKHLAEGLGFTYNDSIRTLGTTTPFFTILLALLSLIFSPNHIPEIARFIDGIFFIASTYLIYKITHKLTGKEYLALLSAFIYCTYPPSIDSSASGMEIPLFIMVFLLSYYLFLNNKTILPGLLGGLLITIRPDGLIWVTALALGYLANKKAILKYIISFATAALPSIILLTIYFGNPLPLSVIAKRVSYGPLYHLDFKNLIGVLGITFPDRIASNPFLVIILWIIIMVFCLLLLKYSFRYKAIIYIPVVGYIILYPAFLWYGRTLMFVWYGYPLFPLVLILLTILIKHNWGNVSSFSGKPFFKFGIIIILFSWIILIAWRVFYFQPAYGQGGPGMVDLEERGYYFRDHTPPDISIFTESIPQIGFISERYIFCEIGLVSPEVVEIKKKYGAKILKDCKWYFDVLRKYKPDFLLLHKEYFDRNRLFPYKDALFFSDYQDSIYFFNNYRLLNINEIIESGNYKGILSNRYYTFQHK